MLAALLVGTGGATGCSTSGPPPAPPVASSAPVAAASRPGFPEGAEWAAARGGDEDALRALADAVPVGDLGLALGRGEGAARVSCGAIAVHQRAELAVGEIAAVLPRLDAADRPACLEALAEVAMRAPRSEPADPDGFERALRAVVALANDPKAPAEDRSKAATAAWALSERRGQPAPTLPVELY